MSVADEWAGGRNSPAYRTPLGSGSWVLLVTGIGPVLCICTVDALRTCISLPVPSRVELGLGEIS